MSQSAKRVKEDPEAQPASAGSGIPDDVLAQVESIQEDIEKLNDEASDKVLEIEKEYNRLRRPFFKKRSEVLRKVPGLWARLVCGRKALFAYASLAVLSRSVVQLFCRGGC